MSQKRNKFLVRSQQVFMKFVSFFKLIKGPEKYIGENTVKDINHVLLDKRYQVHKVMIVTGSKLVKTNKVEPLYENLRKNGIEFTVYSNIENCPTIENVEQGYKQFKEKKCEAIIAFGGGSVIDCSKIILARASNPQLSVEMMEGMMKIKKSLPLLVAIPTTCGSGSESTFSAIITNDKTNRKIIITDVKLLPKFIILDPKLIDSLTNEQIAFSGMEALSHAIEAYLSTAHSSSADRFALDAINLINSNLELVTTKEGKSNTKAKENLLVASHYAGVAISKAYVGYVEAISHSLSSKYNLPHGYLNAVLLPYVLEAYGPKIYRRLAVLADEITFLSEDEDEKRARWMINRIKSLNSYLEIKNKLKSVIKDEDIESLANTAFDEAYLNYPTPRELSVEEIADLIRLIKKDSL